MRCVTQKTMILFVVSMMVSCIIHAQVGVPEIGKPFPDITFHSVANFDKQDFSVGAQKGKWVIINYWSLGCTSCFSVFRKVREINQVHGDRIQFLQVGKKDSRFNIEIESIYKRISDNMKLKVPATFDSLLHKTWDISTYPHIYIIDPEGILRFITDGRDLYTEKISALLEKQQVTFYQKDDQYTKEFDVSFLSEDTHVRTAALISESTGEAPFENVELYNIGQQPTDIRAKGWWSSMVTLGSLYNLAWFGKEFWSSRDTALYAKVFPYPLLEMSDTSLFRTDYTVTPATGVYNCFIKLPITASTDDYKQELRDRLKVIFGYNSMIQTRDVAVWALVAKEGALKNLRTRGDAPYRTLSSAAGGFVLRNQPVDELIRYLTAHIPYDRKAMFVDATGISTNIDFSVKGDMTDFKIVQRELARHGLSFVRQTRAIKVLVLKD